MCDLLTYTSTREKIPYPAYVGQFLLIILQLK